MLNCQSFESVFALLDFVLSECQVLLHGCKVNSEDKTRKLFQLIYMSLSFLFSFSLFFFLSLFLSFLSLPHDHVHTVSNLLGKACPETLLRCLLIFSVICSIWACSSEQRSISWNTGFMSKLVCLITQIVKLFWNETK